MNGLSKFKNLLLLLPLLVIASCDNSTSSSDVISSEEISSETMSEEILPPTHYEIDESVTNANGGVYYEIFVRSFADSNGDGAGDLNGIRAKLPYLENLGIKGLWLTPIHPSPSDHGYDISDYNAIHPDFGTLSDFDALISEARSHNIEIILDLVINHSANSHPWFIEGRTNFRNGNFDPLDETNKANWYNFSWNGANVEWEYSFHSGMPDLNLNNSKVKAEFVNIAKFWLDRGVHGFRLDATTHFFKTDRENIAFLSWFQDEVRAYKADAYIVAEAWITSFENLKYYFNGVDSVFNFNGADVNGYIIDRITSRNGATLAHYLDANYNSLYALNEDAQMAMFLTNHDMDRSSQMFLFDFDERQRIAANIYLLTPGVPFMYYGEEIALKGSRRNTATDANRRLPMIWQKTNDTMRTNTLPLMDYPMEQQVKDGVLEHLATPFSLLNHYRKVINVRNHYPWLSDARLSNVPVNNNAIASLKLTSRDGDEIIHVIHNVVSDEQEINLSRFISDYEVDIVHDIFSTHTRATLVDGILTLAPYSSVVLERK